MKEKRLHYRVGYPKKERLSIYIGEQSFSVTDVSETGLKFISNNDYPVVIDDHISGTITFHSGESVDVAGTVLRVSESEVAVTLHKRVPFGTIIREQRYLMKNYRHID